MSLKIDLNILHEQVQDLQFVPTVADLEKWYTGVASKLEEDCHVSVSIVDPDYIQELNRTYRGKDYPTNVLSFEFDGGEEEQNAFGFVELGDLIICPEVLEREAKEQEKALRDHWTHICLHGLLHLLGYDHIEPDEAEEMESKEKALLADLGIADPYRDDEVEITDLD